MSANGATRSRFSLLLAAGQVRYQVLLMLRSPMSAFTALVMPLMVLIALDVATPQVATRQLHHTSYAEFVTPAMATFALLNACYVGTLTSVVIAREEGVLKRLHGTPLPLWAYVLGRLAASAVVGIASVIVVLAAGAIFMHVDLSTGDVGGLAAVLGLGILSFTTAGLAVSTLVPRPEAALPVAYGTMLPIAFVSDVFFPASAAPDWLRHAASAFPLAPIADASERVVAVGARWPMTLSQFVVTVAWIGGASLVTALGFRWEPGTAFVSRRLRWHGRRPYPHR